MENGGTKRYRYIEKLWEHDDLTRALCITGLRGSGKSTILRHFVEELRQWHVPERKIIYMDAREVEARSCDEFCSMVEAEIREDGSFIVLDSVDAVKDWDTAIYRISGDWKHRVYFAGNRLTAHDMKTKLYWKIDTLHVRPMSFLEYLDADPRGNKAHPDWCIGRYLRSGGLPVMLADYSDARALSVLKGIYETAVHEDLGDRVGMDRGSMDRVVEAVMGSGGPEDMRYYSDMAYVDDTSSTWSCLWALENWHLMDHTYEHGRGMGDIFPRFRMYMEDTGILHSVLPDMPTELLMENAVYGELMRRGCHVSSGSFRRREATFITYRNGKHEAIQVIEDLDDPLRRRWALDALERSGCEYRTLLTLENPDRDLPDSVSAWSLADWLLEKPDNRDDWS
ncbi:MAG: AAA family ATPase [Thermoplasmata archaeon]|nr:AAA family ATPase [Thermoplasmata archaeon]